jgi:hypothetical protein
MLHIVRAQGRIAKRQHVAIDIKKHRLVMIFAYDTMQ